jgi:hypothetical protein
MPLPSSCADAVNSTTPPPPPSHTDLQRMLDADPDRADRLAEHQSRIGRDLFRRGELATPEVVQSTRGSPRPVIILTWPDKPRRYETVTLAAEALNVRPHHIRRACLKLARSARCRGHLMVYVDQLPV